MWAKTKLVNFTGLRQGQTTALHLRNHVRLPYTLQAISSRQRHLRFAHRFNRSLSDMTYSMALKFFVRTAHEEELAALADIESKAASVFEQIPELASECHYPAMPVGLLKACQVYVAAREISNEDRSGDSDREVGGVLGYVAIRRLDDAPYIAKVAVLREVQRQGIGTALLAHAESRLPATDTGAGLALTTFKDVPWNGKWYKSLGFEEIPDSDILLRFGPAHLALFMQSKEKHEHSGWKWVLMAKTVM